MPNGVIGWGEVAHRPWQYHPDRYDLTVEVAPGSQRSGVGTMLLQALLTGLEERRAEVVRAVVREDEAAGLAFLRAAGFQEVWRNLESRLDVEHFDVARWQSVTGAVERAGIAITDLASELEAGEGILRDVYELYLTSDSVELDPITPPPLDAFVAGEVPADTTWASAWLLAHDGDVLVGLSTLEPLGAARNAVGAGFTIVHPSHRGRGIARALKVRTIAWAREHGFRWIESDSNAVNAPMLGLNESLGFRPLPARITLERRLR